MPDLLNELNDKSNEIVTLKTKLLTIMEKSNNKNELIILKETLASKNNELENLKSIIRKNKS